MSNLALLGVSMFDSQSKEFILLHPPVEQPPELHPAVVL